MIDLDAYNITSDDFRDVSTEATSSKRHKLPRLDFKKIFEWREKANNKKNDESKVQTLI